MSSNVFYNVLVSPITRASFLPKIDMHIHFLLICSRKSFDVNVCLKSSGLDLTLPLIPQLDYIIHKRWSHC